MGKAWRIVISLVLVLLVLGLVLLGAAWLTGASPLRIVELVFNGRTGLKSWLEETWQNARSLWAGLEAQIMAIF